MVEWVFLKIGGFPPKWMVKIMETPIKMDDLVPTPIFGNTQVTQMPKWIIQIDERHFGLQAGLS